jgi:hypothetical protein
VPVPFHFASIQIGLFVSSFLHFISKSSVAMWLVLSTLHSIAWVALLSL